ncbi:MAG: LLM class flavin-dependent oxidoreductase [SAR202 cluster bacterium]|nr:LLM class flavin-dependent oxidoreductase [SAR202 cluster bacterium]
MIPFAKSLGFPLKEDFVKFILIYPNLAGYSNASLAADVAEEAEQAGFDTVMHWDHYGLPTGPETMDCWLFLSYIAARTSRIRLGTCVTPIPFRPPAQLAKIVATLDYASGGRVILGVGAGWHKPEFDGYSQWDRDGIRVAKTIEGVRLMLRLWQEKKVDFEGEFYRSIAGELVPKPVQKPHPKLWFGVRGPKMMRFAAEVGQGWIPSQLTPAEYRERLDTLHAHRREMGVTGPFEGAIQMFNAPRDNPDKVTFYNTTTDAKKYLKAVDDFGPAGLDYLGIVWSFPPEEGVSRVKWFRKEVMSRVK